ncbi:carboxypeptidase regulatory-like domain-containing protein [bacterium]|nr:carboxypeptidase regulatory-like domain-containing protein [candidate division CSSED10-310 bacterium]
MSRWIIIFFIAVVAGSAGDGAGLVRAGDIEGYVIDAVSGQPISGLDMNVYDADWQFVDNNALTLNGYYRFYNLPAGSYYVRANPGYPYHYQHQYWQNAPDRAAAVPVMVPETGVVSGIDFALETGWYIEGKITTTGGIVLADIDINVYDAGWTLLDVDTESDEYGRYYIGGLPGGDYYVMANPVYMQPYVDQYFDLSAGPLHATLVTLIPPDDLFGISFTLDDGTYICGQVTDRDTGALLAGMNVKAYDAQGRKMRLESRTDADGRYTLGAYRSGSYFVRVDPSYPDGYMDTYYPDVFRMVDALPVAVDGPKPVFGIDIAVPAGSYIRGCLTTRQGDALQDIKMSFYDRDRMQMELATSYSSATGDYLSGALKPGRYYVKAVPIYPQPWIDIFYPDAVEIEDAETVSVALAGETTGIDLALDPGVYLSGTITHATGGEPLAGVDMDIYNESWGWVDYSDHTDASGLFLIGALPFGRYYVRADPSRSLGYIPQYFDRAFYRSDAVCVDVSDGTSAEQLDFVLDDGGQITGRIVDAMTGDPLSGIGVHLLNSDRVVLPLHSVQSDDKGDYIVHGVPSGSFIVVASMDHGDGYREEYFSEAAAIDAAIPVAMTAPGTVPGIDFTLDPEPIPTATPAVTLGVQIELPSDVIHPGDLFYLNVRAGNPGQALPNVPLFVILDVYGDLFFWPGWVSGDTGWDFAAIDLKTGIQIIPVIPPFTWPDISGSAGGLMFYAGMTRSDFSRLLGDMDMVSFGYSPGD